MTEIRKTETEPLVIRSVDAPRRRFLGIGSKGAAANPASEDSMGDVVEVAGLDFSRYRKNRALLRDHDPRTQIGTVVRDWIAGDEWQVEAELYPRGTTAAADEAWAEIRAGGRSGLSIGFQPLAWEPRTTARGGTGIWYKRSLLLEVSSVTLPACPECLLTQRCLQHHDDAVVLVLDDAAGGDAIVHLVDEPEPLYVFDGAHRMTEAEIRAVVADTVRAAVGPTLRAAARLRRSRG